MTKNIPKSAKYQTIIPKLTHFLIPYFDEEDWRFLPAQKTSPAGFHHNHIQPRRQCCCCCCYSCPIVFSVGFESLSLSSTTIIAKHRYIIIGILTASSSVSTTRAATTTSTVLNDNDNVLVLPTDDYLCRRRMGDY
jgi:hypothetical protein